MIAMVAQVLRILELIQRNMVRGMLVTKRDMYYQSLDLFPSQQASNRIIDQVVTLLGCRDRLELGIVASPRGIISGSLRLIPPFASPEQVVECKLRQTTIIPTEISIDTGWAIEMHCSGREANVEHLVIVVEKEAVFKALLQHGPSPEHENCRGIQWNNVILLTAKGYPDHATRSLVQLLDQHTCWRCRGAVKMVGLFDADPYGVDIHRQFQLHTPVRGIEWLGVDLADFLPTSAAESEESSSVATAALVPLRNDERLIAARLLRGSGDSKADLESRARLTGMLLSGYKVEIEAAYGFSSAKPLGEAVNRSGLVGYIENKLQLRAE